jgi:hypothetical protein
MGLRGTRIYKLKILRGCEGCLDLDEKRYLKSSMS